VPYQTVGYTISNWSLGSAMCKTFGLYTLWINKVTALSI
jgi:hypothetical protein